MSSLLRRFGATVLPVESSDVTGASSFAASLDPARDTLLELFATAITSELGSAWTTLATGTALASTSVIGDKLPLAADRDALTEYKAGFPLLCVAREGEATHDEHTLHEERITQRWTVDYILGPLSIVDTRKLSDILTAVIKVIQLTIRQQGHPDYQSGALQFGDAYEDVDGITDGSGGAKLSTVRIVSSNRGRARIAQEPGSPTYLAASLVLETTELDGPVDNDAPLFEGTSISAGQSGPGGLVAHFIEGDTSIPVE